MSFKSITLAHGEELVQNGFFSNDPGNGVFRGKPRPFVLKDGINNLYPAIRADVLAYFRQNQIVWWGGGNYPTGHILSSQIACLNHLFSIRQDKTAVLNLLKTVCHDFVDVLPIKEEYLTGYIRFEAVGDNKNYLNERFNLRGSNCISVDALIYALHKNGKRFLIPIEWKYVETYGNEDKSYGISGETRRQRYLNLMKQSKLLNSRTLSCCWFEPLYQLMRQTLWTEQLLYHKVPGLVADDYLHLHVIPDGNVELLNKKYRCSGKRMEETWRECLNYPNKYIVVSPQKLWSRQEANTPIYQYLQKRYW